LQDSSGICEAQPTTTGLTWSCSSDIRLKENITNASSSLDYINGLPLFDYTVKKTRERTMGHIAQKMLETYPELVNINNEDGYYMVSEINSWKLVNAIKELKNISEQTNSKLNSSEQKIQELENKVNELQTQLNEIQSKLANGNFEINVSNFKDEKVEQVEIISEIKPVKLSFVLFGKIFNLFG